MTEYSLLAGYRRFWLRPFSGLAALLSAFKEAFGTLTNIVK
jgi:hypothetical protein